MFNRNKYRVIYRMRIIQFSLSYLSYWIVVKRINNIMRWFSKRRGVYLEGQFIQIIIMGKMIRGVLLKWIRVSKKNRRYFKMI
jgi:hypothetical protein